ncbi:MAG TPA: hypothetical protein VGF21_10950 [Thermoleophilaceae bacterium]|jgi:hypothetical protein
MKLGSRAALVTAIGIALLATAAFAAKPVKGGHYSGQTSQKESDIGVTVHHSLAFTVSGNRKRVKNFHANPPFSVAKECRGGIGGPPGFLDFHISKMKIHKGGTFKGTQRYKFQGQVERISTVKGKFGKHRKASGKITTKLPLNHTTCGKKTTAKWKAKAKAH